MGKIVNINENDLKRIVKRVLNERQLLNEFDPITWTIIAGVALIAGGTTFAWWDSKPAYDAFKDLYDGCDDGEIGKPIQSSAEHKSMARKINDAISGPDPFGRGEAELAKTLGTIKSVPDFCAVKKAYSDNGYGDLHDDIDGDINFSSWESKVRIPLSKAMKYTQEQNEKLPEEKSGEEKPGGGNTSSSTASGDGSVSDLQRLLKDKGFDVGSSGVDGRFGKDTLAATIKALRSLK